MTPCLDRVEQLLVTMKSLAGDTETAIEQLREISYPFSVVGPEYGDYLAGIYRQADLLCHCEDVTWVEHVAGRCAERGLGTERQTARNQTRSAGKGSGAGVNLCPT